MSKELILVLGGARSGKSHFAQVLAREKGRRVLFVATAEAGDEEMAARIRAHQAARPREWRTLEEPWHLAESLEPETEPEVMLVDCLSLWVSNLLLQGYESTPLEALERRILDEASRLLECYQKGKADFILVSNEVGMGLVPEHPLGRHYRDLLGRVNQLVASRADKVYLVVAGLALELKSLGARPITEGGRRKRR